MRKIISCFAVAVIFLFVGVALAPCINFSDAKAASDNEMVEVTSQACGIRGFGNTTVKLTKQQYQDLQQYLVDFRNRLNKTITREDAVPLYKEAVVELNKYGLLPKGMNIKQAQKLVTGRTLNILNTEHSKEFFLKNYMGDTNDSNYFCLVSGQTSETLIIGPFVRIADLFGLGFQPFSGFFNLISFFLLSFVLFTNFIPIHLFSTIGIGSAGYNYVKGYYEQVPASGWVHTIGLNGRKIFENNYLYGKLPLPSVNLFFDFILSYPGIYGFTGINLYNIGSVTNFYLGSALWVKIGSEPPNY